MVEREWIEDRTRTNKPLHYGPRPKGSTVASTLSTQKGRIGLGVAGCIECLNLCNCKVEGCEKSTKIDEEGPKDPRRQLFDHFVVGITK